MALPSSGPLSMSQIRAELVNSGIGENIPSTAYGLRALSAAAGKSTPDGMDEFYGYSAGGVTYTAYWSTSVKISGKIRFEILRGGNQEVFTDMETSGSFTFTSGDGIDLISSISSDMDGVYLKAVVRAGNGGLINNQYANRTEYQYNQVESSANFTAPSNNIYIEMQVATG
jgi:hypothetical protein